ncbi:MAG: aminopeptidase [Flavobacteriaceae bacterium]|nr:aminopeptidase [Flavobacteriaceae bacterium]
MKKKDLTYFIISCFMALQCWAQESTIKLEASLDAAKQIVNIQQQINYINTSKDTLSFIYLHNWPNSFKNRHTTLAKRLLDDYDRKLYFAKIQRRGYTKILNIQTNYNQVKFYNAKDKSDIIKIELNKPLAPNKSVEIMATYKVKLPDITFTGYGASPNNFYLKYWYLIPAVYENGQWKTMQNINLDDMYSMPYTYEISFVAPSVYSLTSNLLISDTYIEKNEVHYKMYCNTINDAEIYLRVDNNFEKYVTSDVAVFTDIESVNLNKKLKSQILNRSIAFIKDYLGAYPYPKIVLTEAAYNKNPIYGFNQLPKSLHPFSDVFEWDIKMFKTLTEKFIDRSFLFNLREDKWLADGLQTYLMMNYVDANYKDVKAIGNLSKLWGLKNFNISKLNFNEKYPFVYQFAARKNLDQALSTRADSLSNFNRKIVNKYKAGMGLKYLNAFIGGSVIKHTIGQFYKKYKLKKVSSHDFERLLKNNTTKDLSWFFNDYIHTKKKIDYTITKAKIKNDSIAVTIKNKRHITVPIVLYGLKNKTIHYKKWFSNIDSTLTVNIPKNGIDNLVLNYEYIYPEFNMRNNWKKTKSGIFNRPIQFRLLKDIEDPNYNQVFYNIYGNYNFYDGFLLGPRLYNETFLKKNFLYKITPTYGFKSKSLTGSFSVRYKYLPEDSNIYQISGGIAGSSFHYAPNLLFNKLSPFVSLQFKRKSLRDVGGKGLMLRYVSVNREKNSLSDPTEISRYAILNLRYGYSKPDIVRDLRYNIDLQIDKNFSKISFDFRYRKLTDKIRQIDFRVFAGAFIHNNTEGDFFSFALDKPSDYLFDYNYLGRSESSGFLSQQIIVNEGGFKSKLSHNFANEWILTTNQSISIWRYVEVYSDLGLVKDQGTKIHFLYDGGFRLNIAHELFEVYFPVLSNNGWEFAQHNYNTRIRFILTTDIASFIKVLKRGFF